MVEWKGIGIVFWHFGTDLETASLNMERDFPKIWQLNGDNSDRGRTTLQTTNGAVTGKVAANILARVFEEESTASPSADRSQDPDRAVL